MDLAATLSGPITRRARGGRVTGQPTSPKVLLIDADPYLGYLIQLDLPDAQIVEANPDVTLAEALAFRPDVVLVDVNNGSVIETLRGKPWKVLGIADAQAEADPRALKLEGLIVRPFVPAELHRTMRNALGMVPSRQASASSPLRKVIGLLGAARVGAVAMAAILQVAGGFDDPLRSLVLASAFVYSAVRLPMRTSSRLSVATDVLMAGILLGITGGHSSDYMLFALVVAAGAGLVLGMGGGMAAAIVLELGALGEVISALQAGDLDAKQLIAMMILFPLTGLAGGLAERIWREDSRRGALLLSEANTVLSTLYRIARAMPGGLDRSNVAAAALDEVKETIGSKSALMLVGEGELLTVAGSYGVVRTRDLIVDRGDQQMAELLRKRSVQVLKRETLPTRIAPALAGHSCWLAAPLRRGSTVGMILAACSDDSRHGPNSLFLRQLADESAVAVENASLFSRVRELSVDEERRRLARELHDGVAQALTHIRFELEFLARHGAPAGSSVDAESLRLSRVADRTLADVRAMILGLNAAVSAEGLTGSLRSYLRDLRGGGGPEIDFQAFGVIRLLPEVEAEIFRVAQEAVSNALRHARANTVWVTLDTVESSIRLVVEDDGRGIGDGKASGIGGVGLKAMHERARAIGADFAIGARPGGGTRVELVLHDPQERYPQRQEHNGSA